jgi:hypothetical protein
LSLSGLTPVSSTGQAPNPVPSPIKRGVQGCVLDSPTRRLCHNNLKWKFVILNPSPFVILSVAKNLVFLLRINSVKNLRISTHYKTEILRLEPQNDIVTQPPSRGMTLLLIYDTLYSTVKFEKSLKNTPANFLDSPHKLT